MDAITNYLADLYRHNTEFTDGLETITAITGDTCVLKGKTNILHNFELGIRLQRCCMFFIYIHSASSKHTRIQRFKIEVIYVEIRAHCSACFYNLGIP